MLGLNPARDREIDAIRRMIRNAAQAGIPALKYNPTIPGVVRTAPTPGRRLGAHRLLSTAWSPSPKSTPSASPAASTTPACRAIAASAASTACWAAWTGSIASSKSRPAPITA